jgi:hypothetical protein
MILHAIFEYIEKLIEAGCVFGERVAHYLYEKRHELIRNLCEKNPSLIPQSREDRSCKTKCGSW